MDQKQYVSAVLLTLLGTLSYGFVLLTAPVSAGSGTPSSRDSVFHVGKTWKYQLQTTVLLNSNNVSVDKNVGYQIETKVKLSSLWEPASTPDNHFKILKLEVIII